VAVLILAALLIATAGSAAASPSRVVDRTLSCKTWGSGYPDPLRVLAVSAEPGYALATNGPQGSPQYVAAQVATGVNGQDQVVFSNAACKPAGRIPLSGKGLKSGANAFGNKWRCSVPATVLIRVRAVFRGPVTVRAAADAPHLSIAQGKLLGGAIAVATKSKAPISFATVGPKGASSIVVDKPRCLRNRR
jgi:hypothetical protein